MRRESAFLEGEVGCETGNFFGVDHELLAPVSIEGKSALGDVCRQEVRIEKRDERLLDGDIGLMPPVGLTTGIRPQRSYPPQPESPASDYAVIDVL
ncbi:hypothetical protein X747_31795 [Mesorhizobium sp. LNJC384A00]|nr:hypothetical protein X747_31795 [Mesorhizobium sp. LNJC384A00]